MATIESTTPAGSARPVTERIRIEQHSATGLLWFGGWLFTLGFLQLPLWKAILAIVIWPYYIGSTVAGMIS